MKDFYYEVYQKAKGQERYHWLKNCPSAQSLHAVLRAFRHNKTLIGLKIEKVKEPNEK